MRRPRLSLIAVGVLLALLLVQPIGTADNLNQGSNAFQDLRGNPQRPYLPSQGSSSPDSSAPPEQYALGHVRLDEHGTSIYLGGGRWRYSSSIGEENVYDGNKYVRYIYNLTSKTVQIGKLIFSHGANGIIAINHTDSGNLIGELKWYAQYYLSDQWNNFTFDNYEYLGATQNEDNATIGQRWWSTNGELNVSYTYTYWNELKMRAKATNWAAQSVPVRVLWALTNISVSPDYTLIYDDSVAVGVELGNEQSIYWHDVSQSSPDININPVLDKENRKAAVVFGNLSSVLDQYETMDIDPTYTVAADIDDDTWQDPYGTPVHWTTYLYVHYGNDSESEPKGRGQLRFSLSIPRDSAIQSAMFFGWDLYDYDTRSHNCYRIDETNVGSLEGDSSMPSVDKTPTVTFDSNGVIDEWSPAINVTDLVQAQVDLADWVTGYYIGLAFETPTYTFGATWAFEDFSHTSSHHAYLIVEYVEGDIYQSAVQSEDDDDAWEDPYGTPNHVTFSHIYFQNQSGGEYRGQFRVQLAIPRGSTIHNATAYGYEQTDDSGESHYAYRIDETNVGALESDSSPPSIDTTPTVSWSSDGVANEWQGVNVTDLVQEQVDLSDWVTGYWIGFAFETVVQSSNNHRFEGYGYSDFYHAYLEVNYTVGDIYQTRVAADIDDDYWQDPYGTPVHNTGNIWSYYMNDTDSSPFETRAQTRFSLAIPRGSTVHNASLFIYDKSEAWSTTHNCYRIDETNVGSLEGDSSMPTVDTTPTVNWDSDTVVNEWTLINVTDLVQNQLDLVDWVTGYYMGFAFETPTEAASGVFAFMDWQPDGTYSAYLEINYTLGNIRQYPIASDVDDAFADYDVAFNVETTYNFVYIHHKTAEENHGFLRFYIDLPLGLTIENATLRLIENADGEAADFRCWRVAGDSWVTAPENLLARPSLDGAYDDWSSDGSAGTQYVNVSNVFNDLYEDGGYAASNYLGIEINQTSASALFSHTFDDHDRDLSTEAVLNVYLEELEDDEYNYVDNNDSDIDSSSDIGTHSSFSDEQSAPDSTYDTLTEADNGDGFWNYLQNHYDQENTDIDSYGDYGTQSTPLQANDSLNSLYMNLQEWNMATSTNYNDWFQNYNTNVDGYADVGTETNPENAQDLGDSDYMTLQEANQGAGGGTTEYIAEAFTDSVARWDSEGNAYDGNWGTATTYNAGAYATADAYPSGYASGFDSGAAGSGTISQVDIIVRMEISGLDASDQWGISLDVGASTGTYLQAMTTANQALTNLTFTDVAEPNDGTWTWAEIRSAQIHFDEDKVGGGDKGDWSIYELAFKITTSAPEDYELNFEYQWTNANYSETNEEVCINVQAYQQTASETLKAWEWTGSDWASLGTFTQNGWNNFTASYITGSTYYIMLNDTLQSDEADQDTWSIDSIILHTWTIPTADYELDFEYQWTTADYDESEANVSIYIQTADQTGGENLKAWEWDGSGWVLLGTITEDAWNNFTCTELDSATYYIKVNDTLQESDTDQDSWNIDLLTLATWNTTNYRLDLEIQWTNINYTRAFEYICIYAGTLDAEDIEVYIWNTTSSAWESLWADLTASGWNNITVAEMEGWASTSTLTLRFLDGNQTNDGTSQDSWEIDSSVFRSWTVSGAEETKFLYESISVSVGDPSTIADFSRVLYEAMSIVETITTVADIIMQLFESLALAVTLLKAKIIELFLFESFVIVESSVFSAGFVRVLFEALTVAESVATTSSFSRVLFETITVVESISFSQAYQVFLYESVSLVEQIVTSSSFQMILYESVTFGSTIATAAAFTRSLPESLTFSETMNMTASHSLTLGESISFAETENISKASQMLLFESFVLSDEVTIIAVHSIVLYESFTFDSTIVTSIAFFKTLFESVSLDSTIDVVASHSLTLHESVVVSEDIGVSKVIQMFLYESFVVSDQPTVIAVHSLVLSESIFVVDHASRTASYSLIMYESFTVSENVFSFKVIQLFLYESFTVSDQITINVAYSIVLSESMVVSDQMSTTASHLLVMYESLVVTENVGISKIIQMFLYESFAISDQILPDAAYSLMLSESVALSDYMTRAASRLLVMYESFAITESVDSLKFIQIFLYESFTVSEQLTLVATHSLILSESIIVVDQSITSVSHSMVLYESFTLQDSVYTEASGGYSVFLYETIAVDDTIVNSVTRGIVLHESIAMVDTLDKIIEYALVLSESITLVDSISTYFTGVYILNLFESISFGENDVWSAYRPILPITSPTTDDLWNPGGPIGYITYLNIFAVVSIGCLAAVVVFYVQRVEPKKPKGAPAELKLKSGVKMISRKTGQIGQKITKKKTADKRRKKGVVTRKRSGKPRGKSYTKKKGD